MPLDIDLATPQWHTLIPAPVGLDPANGDEVKRMGQLLLDNIAFIGKLHPVAFKSARRTSGTYDFYQELTNATWDAVDALTISDGIAIMKDDIMIAVSTVSYDCNNLATVLDARHAHTDIGGQSVFDSSSRRCLYFPTGHASAGKGSVSMVSWEVALADVAAVQFRIELNNSLGTTGMYGPGSLGVLILRKTVD